MLEPKLVSPDFEELFTFLRLRLRRRALLVILTALDDPVLADSFVRDLELVRHQHLVLVNETLGPEWLSPERYRIGASSLLNDVLMQLRFQRTGLYSSPDYFTVD